jgi:hypothetical protein
MCASRRFGGTVSSVGVYGAFPTVSIPDRRHVRSTAACGDHALPSGQDRLRRMMDLARYNRVDLRPLFTHDMKLGETPAGYDLFRQRKDGGGEDRAEAVTRLGAQAGRRNASRAARRAIRRRAGCRSSSWSPSRSASRRSIGATGSSRTRLAAGAVAVLVLTWRRLPLSNASYTMLFVFLVLHEVGAHYTYSEVPYGRLVPRPCSAPRRTTSFGVERNHYDRVVHFMYGAARRVPDARGVRPRRGTLGASGATCCRSTS